MPRPPNGLGADSKRYRIIWPELSTGPGSKNATSSFSVSTGHTNEALYFFCDFLRNQGVDFVSLASANGSAYRPVGLKGFTLAYGAANNPHPLASDIDLIDKPFPEDIVIFGN
jgi:hypothetical protein